MQVLGYSSAFASSVGLIPSTTHIQKGKCNDRCAGDMKVKVIVTLLGVELCPPRKVCLSINFGDLIKCLFGNRDKVVNEDEVILKESGHQSNMMNLILERGKAGQV